MVSVCTWCVWGGFDSHIRGIIEVWLNYARGSLRRRSCSSAQSPHWPLHPPQPPVSFHHVPPSQVGALIRASGYPSKSPGRERGRETQKEIGGKWQEVGEEESRDRDWFEKGEGEGGRGGWWSWGCFLLFLTAGLISCLHFTAFHRYFTEC